MKLKVGRKNKSFYHDWINYPSIQALKRSLLRETGSEGTLKSYVFAVKYFVDYLGYDGPEGVLGSIRRGEIDLNESINSYIDSMLKRVSRSSVANRLASLKKWTQVNGVDFDWDKNVEMPRIWVETQDRAPTKEELRLLMNHGDLRDRVMLTLLTSTGLRAGTVVKLKVGDVDFDWDPEILKIDVRASRAKERVKHYALATPEARRFLEMYLDMRRNRGEEIGPESPLIAAEKHGGMGSPIKIDTIRLAYNTLLSKAGLDEKDYKWRKIHLHTLRKYFRTNCDYAGIPRDTREFLMGHRGGYLARSYHTPSEKMIRNTYKKVVPQLTITESKVSDQEIRRKQVLDMAKMLGYPEDKIKRVEEALAKYETVDEALEEIKKLGKDSYKAEETMINGGINGRRFNSKVVSLNELTGYIDQGWEYLANLDGDRFLIKKIGWEH